MAYPPETAPVNIGTNPNDGTGDNLRTAFDNINQKFYDLESTLGGVQFFSDTSDTPTSNPSINSFAIYRGTDHNTVWGWDPNEEAWFPIVTV